MPPPTRTSRTLGQRRQLRGIREQRERAAFRVAYKYGPVIRWCQGQGWSQRRIVAYFNERGFPLPSEALRGGIPSANKRWHLCQIQRLIQRVEALREKMLWKYRHMRNWGKAQEWNSGVGEVIADTVGGWLAMCGPEPARYGGWKHRKGLARFNTEKEWTPPGS